VILAAGLSPAWQQVFAFDTLTVGAVNRARSVWSGASGKVVNVAAALHALEPGRGRFLSVAGGNTGQAMIEDCARRGLDARWIAAQAPTRLCTTIVERAPVRATELVENAPPVAPDELAEFFRVYSDEAARAEVVVLIGSLPAGAPATVYRDLLKRTPGRAVLDCRGAELLSALDRRPFLVKPNREELAATLQLTMTNDTELLHAMHALRQRGAEWVVVTHGKEAVWAAGPGVTLRLEPPTITAVNPIGSGDCLAAGLAWSLAGGAEVPEALRLGVACAAENASGLLTAQLDWQRVRAFRDAVRIQQVKH
jgi:1-phosphofructokinase family hexose kinase